jgi:hypothetical protein
MLPFRGRHLLEGQLYAATFGTFGVLFCLWWLRPERLAAFVRRRPEDAVLVVATYLSLAFANNTDRLLAYSLPAVVPAALVSLRFLSGFGVTWGTVAAITLGLQAFVWAWTPFHELGISIYPQTRWPVVLALGAFWLGLRLLMRANARAA